MNLSQLYEHDFYAWTLETRHLLKNREFTKLDTEHLLEEMKWIR